MNSSKKIRRILSLFIIVTLVALNSAFADSHINIQKNAEKTLNIINELNQNLEKSNLEKIKEWELKKKNGVIYYSQKDERWAYNNYGVGVKGNIYNNGCGPTSMAMVISTFLEEEITPDVVASFAKEHHHMMPNNGGSYWSLFPDASEEYGLNCTETKDVYKAKEALKNGALIILSQNNALDNYWTFEGHFIVLTKINDDGSYLVNDPYSEKRTEDTHTENEVFYPMKKMWIIEKSDE